MPPKKEISLLPDENNSQSFSNRFIRWLTTAGRFVIVFTELIVIMAFVSRFWLDRKNADLSETIRQQTAILQSTKDFENEYLFLQQRLEFVKKYYNQAPDYAPKIQSLIESSPPGIVYDRFSLSRSPESSLVKSDLIVFAYQESSIVDFVTNLILNPDIGNVNIKNIEKKPKDTKYTISLSLSFNPPSTDVTR
jgi:hypothetical protein